MFSYLETLKLDYYYYYHDYDYYSINIDSLLFVFDK